MLIYNSAALSPGGRTVLPLQWAGEEGGARRDSELEHDQWRDTAGRQLSTYKAGTSITVLSHCCL